MNRIDLPLPDPDLAFPGPLFERDASKAGAVLLRALGRQVRDRGTVPALAGLVRVLRAQAVVLDAVDKDLAETFRAQVRQAMEE